MSDDNWLFYFLVQPKKFKINGTFQQCNSLNVFSDKKSLALKFGWEGIPFNFVFFTIIFVTVLAIFTCIRRRAWRREPRAIPLIKRGWIQFIYGDRPQNWSRRFYEDKTSQKHIHGLKHEQLIQLMREGEQQADSISITSRPPVRLSITPEPDLLTEPIEVITEGPTETEQSPFAGPTKPTSELDKTESIRRQFIRTKPLTRFETYRDTSMELKNWLWDLIFINDYDVLAKKGPDAYHYLMFQSYIIRFLAIVTSVSIVIILPINMFGTESSSTSSFAQTTISNITSDSNLLWVHVACSLFLFAVSLWMMCHFSRAVNANANNYVKRTLLIQNVPKRMRVQAAVSEYFERIFPNIGIEGIQFVYNTKELRLLHSQFTASVNARTYCIEYNSSSAKRLAVPSCCLARCCCSGDGEDALNYYDKQIETLESRVTKEFYQTIGRPTGSMFITFKTPEMAKTVYQHLVELHEQSWAHFISARIFPTCPTLMKLTNGDEMMSDMWIVSKAPYPEDINWDDIGQDYRWLWFRKFFVHVILFLIFFFFSTPSIFLNTLSFIEVTQNLKKGVSAINPVFSEFVSPLMLVFFSTILPTCVTIACDYLPFKTFASKNRSVMWKVFSFLLLMVVILPSLGLTSAQALVVSAITNSTKTVECLFPVDNGAFFVNYVVQSTFVANAMELVRIPELFLYLYYYTFSIKSEAEFEKARRDINFDFQFGLRYPRFMLIFCLVITYSLACPMIAPFGLMYMSIKHLVDRYNMYYIYTPSKISASIHSTAITFFQIAILMMLSQMSTFITLRTGSSIMSTTSLMVLFVAGIIFFGQCFCHCCWNIGVTIPVTKKKIQIKRDFCSCAYLAPVLYDINMDGINDQSKFGQTSTRSMS